jgi:hypothetical protein
VAARNLSEPAVLKVVIGFGADNRAKNASSAELACRHAQRALVVIAKKRRADVPTAHQLSCASAEALPGGRHRRHHRRRDADSRSHRCRLGGPRRHISCIFLGSSCLSPSPFFTSGISIAEGRHFRSRACSGSFPLPARYLGRAFLLNQTRARAVFSGQCDKVYVRANSVRETRPIARLPGRSKTIKMDWIAGYRAARNGHAR